jgi:hypothetical protein
MIIFYSESNATDSIHILDEFKDSSPMISLFGYFTIDIHIHTEYHFNATYSQHAYLFNEAE